MALCIVGKQKTLGKPVAIHWNIWTRHEDSVLSWAYHRIIAHDNMYYHLQTSFLLINLQFDALKNVSDEQLAAILKILSSI